MYIGHFERPKATNKTTTISHSLLFEVQRLASFIWSFEAKISFCFSGDLAFLQSDPINCRCLVLVKNFMGILQIIFFMSRNVKIFKNAMLRHAIVIRLKIKAFASN